MFKDKKVNVSIIIPCRNEEKFIARCLDSIIANDYPKDRLEALVVDGMSKDETRRIIERYTQQYPFIKLLDNSKKIIATTMNIGIKHASGEIIMKVDAHSTYPKDYISNYAQYLREYQADNIGGVLNIMPGRETTVSKTIALVLAHPFGSGNAYIKIGSKDPRWTDAAAFGYYKKEIFQKVGLFNENVGSEDMDLNVSADLKYLW